MLYLGIDQHAKQLTVCLRDEAGQVQLRRQVSTRPAKVREFFDALQELSQADGGFAVILEVCGFNEWLIDMLQQYHCREIVLIQPDTSSKKKTDRRDANQLSELLWVNRHRLQAGEKIQGVRRICIVSERDLADRRLTAARYRASQQRSRVVNKIKQILRRHNLQWEYPTKTFATNQGREWLEQVPLPELDRLEMTHLLSRWDLYGGHIYELERRIQERCHDHPLAQLLLTVPGIQPYIALALASRINAIERFPRPRSLANYWGLTPGCHNSGETTNRLGSITKQGSKIARFLLGQLVLHVLRHDGQMRAWYNGIRRRRGSKIARVAMMRRLCTVLWHLLTEKRPYQCRGKVESARQKASGPAKRSRKPTASRAKANSAGEASPRGGVGLSPEGQKRSGKGTRPATRRPRSSPLSTPGSALGSVPTVALSSVQVDQP
jgi:transposase